MRKACGKQIMNESYDLVVFLDAKWDSCGIRSGISYS